MKPHARQLFRLLVILSALGSAPAQAGDTTETVVGHTYGCDKNHRD